MGFRMQRSLNRLQSFINLDVPNRARIQTARRHSHIRKHLAQPPFRMQPA